ncbi:MAG: methyltransferase [Alphaproteobacteria bacterium]|nr:MAG: methyltransferase [Alphaproteobacteria bacterium]
MSQKITSLYKLVTIPFMYELIQRTLGQKKTRHYLCNGPLKTNTGDRVLDVGCGPATLRPFLGDICYKGMDLNPSHIEHATKDFGHLGTFICSNAVTDTVNAPGPYDLIYCIGLLHHLDDDEARTLINSLSARLADGGRLVTYDPVYVEKQNFIAKWLNDLDSGQNIRTAQGYANLFDDVELPLDTHVLSGMLNVPYNHCCNIVSQPK